MFLQQKLKDYLAMTVPKYCGSNDPLLSYTTRLHPMEAHTTARQPINTIPYNDKSNENEVKKEIKTETKDVNMINIGMCLHQDKHYNTKI